MYTPIWCQLSDRDDLSVNAWSDIDFANCQAEMISQWVHERHWLCQPVSISLSELQCACLPISSDSALATYPSMMTCILIAKVSFLSIENIAHGDDIKFSCVMYAWPIVRGYCIGQLQRPSGSICALVTRVNFCWPLHSLASQTLTGNKTNILS